MRSITRLIEQVRRQTENEDVTDFTGISDKEFIQYLNDAQYNLQSQIVHQHPNVFIEEAIIQTVGGQERYNLPSNCFLSNKVHNVEYSSTGNDEDYYTLRQATIKSRSSGIDADPSSYIRLSSQILLVPQPTSGGTLRINYVKRLRELSKAAAKVDSAGITINSNPVNNVYTIPLDPTSLVTNLDLLEQNDFICIVDKEGNAIVSNIEILSVNSTEITYSLHTPSSTDNLTVPGGSVIVSGKDTTTHSELGIEIERYLIAYCAWKILKRDSSVDSQEAIQEMASMLSDIVKSYGMVSDDVQFVPDLHTWDDWSF